MVRFPCFRIRYSLGKSSMTLFWIRWSLHSFPVYHRFYRHWQYELSFVAYATFVFYKNDFSSPLSSAALCLKYCLECCRLSAPQLSLHCNLRSTNSIESFSLRPSPPAFCGSGTKISSTSTIFG